MYLQLNKNLCKLISNNIRLRNKSISRNIGQILKIKCGLINKDWAYVLCLCCEDYEVYTV